MFHLGARVTASGLRYFDPDEFEHLHAAYEIHQGEVIYRDFFEHHAPLYYYVIAPLFGAEPSTVDLPARARNLTLVTMALGLVLVFLWGQQIGGAEVGLLATLLLAAEAFNTKSTIEIRPDALQYPAVLLGGWLFVRALETKRYRHAGGAGTCMAVALLCTPRSLLVGVGLLALWLWGLARSDDRRRTLGLGVLTGAVVATGVGLAAAAFAAAGALRPFLYYNFTFNLNYGTKVWPWTYLRQTFWANPELWILGLGGLVAWLWGERRTPLSIRRAAVLIFLLSGLVGAFFVPNPAAQYWLNVTPWLALIAGWQLSELVRRPSLGRIAPWLLALAVACVLAALWPRPARSAPAWGWLGVAVAAGLTALAAQQRHPAAAALVVVTALWWPSHARAIDIANMAAGGSESAVQQRELLAKVHRLAAGGAVLDGFTGLGYREPRISFYPFVHGELIDTVGLRSLRRRIETDVANEPPRVVLLDGWLRELFGVQIWRVLGHYRIVTRRSWTGWQTPWVEILVRDATRHPATPLPTDPRWHTYVTDMGWKIHVPEHGAAPTRPALVALELPPDVAGLHLAATLIDSGDRWHSSRRVLGRIGLLPPDGTPTALFAVPPQPGRRLDFFINVGNQLGVQAVARGFRIDFAKLIQAAR